MIKGINRQVVEVRETNSDYFERILFFIKPECASVSEGKLRERAGLIASSASKPPATKSKGKILRELGWMALCLIGGIVIGAVVF